jgi:hypothetical protein
LKDKRKEKWKRIKEKRPTLVLLRDYTVELTYQCWYTIEHNTRGFSYSSQLIEFDDVVVVVGEYFYKTQKGELRKGQPKEKGMKTLPPKDHQTK